jgi:hypothetical protein
MRLQRGLELKSAENKDYQIIVINVKSADLRNISDLSNLVRVEGLEPPRLAAPEPKSGASAISPHPHLPARL